MSHDEIQYKDSGIPQPYHLVEPSIWPILGAVAAGLMMGGMVLFMHKVKIHQGSISAGAGRLSGLVGVLAIMRRVVARYYQRSNLSEIAFAARKARPALWHGPFHRFGSDVLLGFLLGLLQRGALSPGDFRRHLAAQQISETVAPFDMPFMMTLILLLSGTTVTWAHHAIVHGDKRGLINGLACTVALGVCFSLCQAYEYTHAEFGLTAGIYGSTFYLATGFHGLHVIIGTIFLAVCLWARNRATSPRTAISAWKLPHGIGTLSMWCGCFCLFRFIGTDRVKILMSEAVRF